MRYFDEIQSILFANFAVRMALWSTNGWIQTATHKDSRVMKLQMSNDKNGRDSRTTRNLPTPRVKLSRSASTALLYRLTDLPSPE